MNENMNEICALLRNSKRIAVVGISRNPNKISRIISNFLVNNGYEVYGVNPSFQSDNALASIEVDNIKIYPKLTDIPYDIDIVDVFRKSEDIPLIIPDVLAKKPKALWLQQGIRNDVAVKPVIDNGIFTVQDICIMVYYNLCRGYK